MKSISPEVLEAAGSAVNIIVDIAREAERNAKPTPFDVGGQKFLVYPDKTIKPLEGLGDAPARRRAAVHLQEVASFIAYVNRHKIPGATHLFGEANTAKSSFVAIIDFHGDTASKLPAGFGDHQVTFEMVKSPEWSTWLANDKKAMTQEQFAEFIEDNMLDIIEPNAADILDVALLLQGKKTVTFKSGKSLRDGSIQFEYSESIETTGGASRRDDSFKVPAKFKIALVPFGGDVGVEVEARLRYRISNNGQLSFHYLLNRPHKVVEEAFVRTRERIEQETGMGVCFGSATVKPTPGAIA